MAPSTCPRCSTTVTVERYAAETTSHACSLCSADLHLELEEAEDLATQTAGDDEEDTGVDALEALRTAVAESEQVVSALQARAADAQAARTRAEEEARRAHDALDSARARLAAELELARAEGALAATEQTDPAREVPRQQDAKHLVLTVASAITKKWVKDDQDPLLVEVSAAITTLARSFGATNITAVHLKGNGNMDVEKGGADTTYSGVTNGEKLRIKLAAAIALVQVGHRGGVGRHPGLLFVDSPTAEEIPESDLRTMLHAMSEVAQETDLQIVVATTHGPMLNEVLPPHHLLVATGNDYVW